MPPCRHLNHRSAQSFRVVVQTPGAEAARPGPLPPNTAPAVPCWSASNTPPQPRWIYALLPPSGASWKLACHTMRADRRGHGITVPRFRPHSRRSACAPIGTLLFSPISASRRTAHDLSQRQQTREPVSTEQPRRLGGFGHLCGPHHCCWGLLLRPAQYDRVQPIHFADNDNYRIEHRKSSSAQEIANLSKQVGKPVESPKKATRSALTVPSASHHAAASALPRGPYVWVRQNT